MYFIALIVRLLCTISTGSKLHAQTTSISGPVIYVGSTCSAAETETTPVITSSTSSSPEVVQRVQQFQHRYLQQYSREWSSSQRYLKQ